MSLKTWFIDTGVKVAGTVKNGLTAGAATKITGGAGAATILGLSIPAFSVLALGVLGLGIYGWTQYQPESGPVAPTEKVSNWDRDQAYDDDERDAEKRRSRESAKQTGYYACWVKVGNKQVLSVRSSEYFGPGAKPLYCNQIRHGGVRKVQVNGLSKIGKKYQTPRMATRELLDVIDGSTLRKPRLAAGQIARLKGSDKWVTIDDWGAVVFGELRANPG